MITRRSCLPVCVLCLLLGTAVLLRQPEPVLVLEYHRVSPRPTGPVPSVTPREFARQMECLARSGYRSISPEDLGAYLRRQAPLPERAVLITFDDGWADNYVFAWPILRRHGYTATVFMISSRVGAPNCLTAAQLRALARSGWAIGAHAVNHRHLPALDPAEAWREITASRATIARITGRPVTAFSYPYGDMDPRSRSLVRAAGYTAAFGTRQGLPRPGQDPFAIKRLALQGQSGSILLHLAINPWFGPMRRLLNGFAGLPPILRVQEAYSRRLGRRPAQPARREPVPRPSPPR